MQLELFKNVSRKKNIKFEIGFSGLAAVEFRYNGYGISERQFNRLKKSEGGKVLLYNIK